MSELNGKYSAWYYCLVPSCFLKKEPIEKVERSSIPTTIFAYMVAQELLVGDYELTRGYDPKELELFVHRGNAKEPFEVKHRKFTVKGRVDYRGHTEAYGPHWGYLTSCSGLEFDKKEEEIILRAFHKSLHYRAEKAKIEKETKRQEDAINLIEKWIGLV